MGEVEQTHKFDAQLRAVRKIAARIVGKPFSSASPSGEKASSSGERVFSSVGIENITPEPDVHVAVGPSHEHVAAGTSDEGQQEENTDKQEFFHEENHLAPLEEIKDDAQLGLSEESDDSEGDDEGDDSSSEGPVSDDEVAKMIEWLMEVESESAEAQEALEEEFLDRVRQEVKIELETVGKLTGKELEDAVSREMAAFVSDWERTLTEREEESAKLQEKLEDAGVSLPELFKVIERQNSEGCVTETWKRRTHWAGTPASEDFLEVLHSAERHLEVNRPLAKRQGKVVEVGASGFLERKMNGKEDPKGFTGWDLLDEPKQDAGATENLKAWAAVYAASTPQEAARLGIEFPGVDKVEEIADVNEDFGVMAKALAAESASGLTEKQKKNLKRIREEDDVHRKRRSGRRCEQRTVQEKKDSRNQQGVTDLGDSKDQLLKSVSNEFKAEASKSIDVDFEREKLSADIFFSKEVKRAELIVLSDEEGNDPLGDCGSTAQLVKDNGTTDNAGMNETTSPLKAPKRPIEQQSPSRSKKRRKIVLDDSGEEDIDNVPVHRSEQEDIPEVKQSDSAGKEESKIQAADSKPKEIDSAHKAESEARQEVEGDPDENQDGLTTKLNSGTPQVKHSATVEKDPNQDGLIDQSPQKEGSNISPVKQEVNCLENRSSGYEEVIQQNRTRRKSKRGNKRFECTICEKSLASKDVLAHTVLRVIVCKSCKETYESSPFRKDEDGSEAECRWCGDGGDVICCDTCDKVFCEKCITRNLGADYLKSLDQASHWDCFLCDLLPLEPLSELLKEAEEGLFCSVSNDVEQLSGSKKEFEIQSRIKRRKNIRKVMTDDELNEATKQQLALEKERRERLEKWYEAAKASGKGKVSVGKPIPDMEHLDEADHLCEGDCKTLGCVVNVADRKTDEPLVRVPASISKLLKPHQLSGVRFMWENCIESVNKVKSGSKGLGCILAHSMGLGKTLQVIAFLYTAMRSADLGFNTALVVVPVNVLHNWRCEFEKWRPADVRQLQVYMMEDRDNLRRADQLDNWRRNGGVMLIGYATFRTISIGRSVKDKPTRDLICECLQNPGPDILICDEAHTIKNKKADITKELHQVRTKRRIAMTGSPLQNNLMEYYCMVDFVREGFLGAQKEFRNRFQNPIANGQHADSTAADVKKMKQCAHVLHQRLAGFVQRKDTTVLKHELPPKCVWVISVRLSALQKQLYRKYLSVCENRKHMLFDNYHFLNKIWNHPDILWLAKEEKDAQRLNDDFIVNSDEEDSDENGQGKPQENSEIDNYEWCKEILDGLEREVLENSGKMILISRLIAMSSSQGDKMLIFSQSLGTLSLIERFLERTPRADGSGCWSSGIDWYRLDGSTSASKRQQIAENFNDPNNTSVKCVLISTRAGSLGINLTGANRVIIVDGSWNPSHDLQALFRSWRYGQTKPVYAYRLLGYGTMEEKIYNRQLTKEGIAARVLDAHQVGRHLNADDLELLYTLNDDEDELIRTEDEQPGAESSSKAKSKHKSFCAPSDAPPRDELMAMLLLDYRPRWIAQYHEHEPLLEDLEDEKLSAEDKAQAWEAFKREHETPQQIPQPGAQQPAYQFQPQAFPSQPYQPSSSYQSFQHQQPFQPFRPAQQPAMNNNNNTIAPCDINTHARMLSSLNVPAGSTITCGKCYHKMNWEDIVRKPRAPPKQQQQQQQPQQQQQQQPQQQQQQ